MEPPHAPSDRFRAEPRPGRLWCGIVWATVTGRLTPAGPLTFRHGAATGVRSARGRATGTAGGSRIRRGRPGARAGTRTVAGHDTGSALECCSAAVAGSRCARGAGRLRALVCGYGPAGRYGAARPGRRHASAGGDCLHAAIGPGLAWWSATPADQGDRASRTSPPHRRFLLERKTKTGKTLYKYQIHNHCPGAARGCFRPFFAPLQVPLESCMAAAQRPIPPGFYPCQTLYCPTLGVPKQALQTVENTRLLLH